MGRTFVVVSLVVAALAGCSSGEQSQDPASPDAAVEESDEASAPGSEPSEPTAAQFTTGDLEGLLQGIDVPKGMKADDPTVETAHGSGPLKDNIRAAGYGFVLLRRQPFSTPAVSTGKPPRAGAMGFYSMAATASVYEDAAGAVESWDNPTAPLKTQLGYKLEPLDGDLGDRARRFVWREKSNFGGTVPFVGVTWLRGNARLSVGGYGLKPAGIDEEALLAMAAKIDQAAEPSGAPPIELPGLVDGGTVALKDSFAKPSSGWQEQEYSDASYSRYAKGSWEMSTPTALITLAGDVDKKLKKLANTSIAFDSRITSSSGAVGAICRQGGDNRYYVASMSDDGRANLGRVTGGKKSAYLSLASVTGVPVGKQRHRVQLDCTGDDLVRLTLQVDGEVVAEALDLRNTIAAGGPGLYVESVEGSATATFDDVTITRP